MSAFKRKASSLEPGGASSPSKARPARGGDEQGGGERRQQQSEAKPEGKKAGPFTGILERAPWRKSIGTKHPAWKVGGGARQYERHDSFVKSDEPHMNKEFRLDQKLYESLELENALKYCPRVKFWLVRQSTGEWAVSDLTTETHPNACPEKVEGTIRRAYTAPRKENGERVKGSEKLGEIVLDDPAIGTLLINHHFWGKITKKLKAKLGGNPKPQDFNKAIKGIVDSRISVTIKFEKGYRTPEEIENLDLDPCPSTASGSGQGLAESQGSATRPRLQPRRPAARPVHPREPSPPPKEKGKVKQAHQFNPEQANPTSTAGGVSSGKRVLEFVSPPPSEHIATTSSQSAPVSEQGSIDFPKDHFFPQCTVQEVAKIAYGGKEAVYGKLTVKDRPDLTLYYDRRNADKGLVQGATVSCIYIGPFSDRDKPERGPLIGVRDVRLLEKPAKRGHQGSTRNNR